MSKKDWTNDWATFVRELDAAYNAGATNRKICKQFGDTEVTWVGVVDSTNIGHSSAKRRGACLTINPEDTPLHRPDGTTYTMGLVVLRIPKEKEEQWKGVSKGDKVRFRAVLPQWILSPSKQLNFTRNQPTPTCTDGELLEVLPAGKPDLKASSDAWKTDWAAFVKEFERFELAENTEAWINEYFDGEVVTWVGQLMDVTKSKGAVEFVMIEMSDVPYRDRHGQEPSGGWIEGSVPKEHRESWSGVSKKMNPIRFEAKLVAKYHDSPGISEEYGLHLCSDSIRFVGQAKAGEFKHFAEDASETAYLDDPVFGTIEFAEEEPGLGVWEAEDEVEFGKHHGEPWRASVTVLAPDTGPTKEQRETFKELLKRYKKLWPKIAEALAVEHHRDDLTVGDIDNAVNHIISFEVQEDEGDGVVIEIQYTLDLEDEGDMGYFVAIRDWKAEPAGAAD